MKHFLLALAQTVWSLQGCATEQSDSSEWTGEWTCSGNWRARAR
jgi:hypothetical protein